MRITTLDVDGFGVWNGLRIEQLRDGLNVLYGPNEAGKSTLMQFVRSLLYGLDAHGRRYLPPVHGGRPGGSAWLAGPTGRFQVSRYLNEEDPTAGEMLAIAGAEGTRQGEHLMPILLANVDEPVFSNVFSLGLRELQELGTLDDTDAAAMLYSLSSGVDRVPLVEVMRQLTQSRNHLLDRRNGPSELSRLLEQHEKLREEIETLGDQMHQFGRLTTEREQTDREVSHLEQEHNRHRHEVRVLEIALAVRSSWADREMLARQLEALGATEAIPEGAAERLEAINERLDRRRQQTDELRRQWDSLRAEADGLQVNDTLWRLTPRIEALEEQSDWIQTLASRIDELEREIQELEARIETEQRNLGLKTAEGGRVLKAISSRTLDSLRQPARAIRRCRARLADAEAQAERSRRASRDLTERVRLELEARGETDLHDAVERAGSLVSQLKRCQQVDQRLEEMAEHEAELDRQSRTLLDQQVMSLQAMVGVGGSIVGGVVLATLGLFGAVHWLVALVGLLAVAGGIGAKFFLEHLGAQRLEGCQDQLRMLQGQRKRTAEEREAAYAQLPSAEGSPRQQLERAERELAALEDLVPAESQAQASRREAEDADQRRQTAERDLQVAGRRWKESLRIAGLPTSLSPRQVRDMAAVGETMGEIQGRLELRYEELGQRRRELESLTARVDKLVADSGLPLESEHFAEKLEMLRMYVEEQETRQQRRRELKRLAKQLRRKRAKLAASERSLKEKRVDLFRSIGVGNETELEQRIEACQRHAALRREFEDLQKRIDAAISGYCGEEAIAEQLTAERADKLETILGQVQRRAEASAAQLKERFERRGRLAEQLEVMAEGRAVMEKQLELGVVETRIREAIHRWRVRAAACRVLDSVRESYEQERQPETLLEASYYLERLTGGRYTRVWTPLGEDVLRVEDRQGDSIAVEVLSRGTREQLFLALRLALVSSFAKRGAPLPVILDDVLVNFDVARAKAAAAVLRDFAAQGHQLLVFTCHEHIANMFRAMDVTVRQLPDSFGTGPKLLAGDEPKRKPKRKEAAPPEPVPVVVEEPPVDEVDLEDVEEEEVPEVEEATDESSTEFDDEAFEEEEQPLVDEDDEDWDDEWEEEDEYDDGWEAEDEVDESDEDVPEDDTDDQGDEEEDFGEGEEPVDRESEDAGWLDEASRRRRGLRDDWDDAYEDEYDFEEDDESFGDSEAA